MNFILPLFDKMLGLLAGHTYNRYILTKCLKVVLFVPMFAVLVIYITAASVIYLFLQTIVTIKETILMWPAEVADFMQVNWFGGFSRSFYKSLELVSCYKKDVKSSSREICLLCKGTGNNTSGMVLAVNNDICPRCGGYGTVPAGCSNEDHVTDEDRGYAKGNGWNTTEPR